MPNDFARNPSGERFSFGGMKTNDAPDALPPGKFPLAINVRAISDNSIKTRPGFPSLFGCGNAFVSDIRAYAALSTDNLPRFLAHDVAGRVWLDTSTQVGALAGPSFGAGMIPFRPNASPQPWMYIANGTDYQKFSSPVVGTDVVTQQKAGIAEPQAAPDAAMQMNSLVMTPTPAWSQGGTAGAPSNSNRLTDTAGTVLQDPTGASVWTVQVGSSVSYQKLMQLTFAATNTFLVVDVFTPIAASITIQSIFYFAGATGHCVIVPATVSSESQSIFPATFIASIRRGAMIVIGSEKCYVWSVSEGPNGSIAIETSTTLTHTTADAMTVLPAISVIPGTAASQSSQLVTVPPTVLTVSDVARTNGAAWSPGNALPSTVTLTTSGGAHPLSDFLQAVGWGFTIPGTAVITGILMQSTWGGQPWILDDDVQLVKAGTIVGANRATGFSASFPTHSYGSRTDLWGSSWTPADINNAGFGIALSAKNASHTNTGTATISAMTADVFYFVPSGGTGPTAGQAITDADITYQVTIGVGTMTTPTGSNPFNLSGISFQDGDYISLGIKIDNLANLTEVKFLLDVGDGSFTQNFYYYAIRPSDVAAAVANTSTQLATSQTVAQHASIDAETAAISAQAGYFDVNSGAQLLPGSGQWSQIVFPISSLIRVGNDQTKSLQTLVKMQFLWNALGTINVANDMPFVMGGFQVDAGDVGAPYQYRVRPRSRNTGVVGNPSPASRYGVSPRRGQVTVYLPSALYDPQIDTWDIFRYGGTVTEWRFIGSTPSGNSLFLDNFDDAAAQAGNALDFDNFEPWPSIDLPNTGIATTVCGTVAVVQSTNSNITGYLPGTLVQIGGLNVYTLWARPTLISGMSYLLQFVENAGADTNVSFIIQEPILANQHLPYMWGPDANGTVFACGDPLRPGSVYFSKNYAPDSAPDSYNQEIVQPAEPLMGGETVDGLAFASSTERWWALYPQPDNPTQRYNVVQQPVPRGKIAPYGSCTDGRAIFFWAKDGIWSTLDGSLTDADLYTLFPHEGVTGIPYTYNGITIQPPDYSRAGGFRLAYANSYLYATYQDSGGVYRTLVYDQKRKAWSVDQYQTIGGSNRFVTTFYHPEQQAGTVLTETALYPVLLAAFFTEIGLAATVTVETDLSNDLSGLPIPAILATREDPGGDVRAPKQWGDFFVDLVPAAASAGVGVTPMSLGAAAAPQTVIPTSASRQRVPVGVGGVVVSDFMGLFFSWQDNFSLQSTWTKLRIWQPSFVVQPAKGIAWTTFGTSFGLDGYMHIRQMSIAYVSTAAITLQLTTYDGQSPAAITLPSTGGAYQKTLFPLPANKGQLMKIGLTSSAPFQIFAEDSDLYVGAWGRTGPYLMSPKFGGTVVQPSPI